MKEDTHRLQKAYNRCRHIERFYVLNVCFPLFIFAWRMTVLVVLMFQFSLIVLFVTWDSTARLISRSDWTIYASKQHTNDSWRRCSGSGGQSATCQTWLPLHCPPKVVASSSATSLSGQSSPATELVAENCTNSLTCRQKCTLPGARWWRLKQTVRSESWQLAQTDTNAHKGKVKGEWRQQSMATKQWWCPMVHCQSPPEHASEGASLEAPSPSLTALVLSLPTQPSPQRCVSGFTLISCCSIRTGEVTLTAASSSLTPLESQSSPSSAASLSWAVHHCYRCSSYSPAVLVNLSPYFLSIWSTYW